MTRGFRKVRHGETVPEVQGCWQGLASVLRDGLAGYPVPRVTTPFWQAEWQAQRNSEAESEACYGPELA